MEGGKKMKAVFCFPVSKFPEIYAAKKKVLCGPNKGMLNS